ncbi:unnamed protein product [Rhizoctonia solani]|uniref:PinX1-related protein 1 n=1 Tax=Rhizoctonia solani TaxID=456999 RepID=A0A8H2WXY5_9AGAM|nr:unnamed protein product [Rhizoctonia solani]
MGLSERKVKQRIGADPRNLAWAENAAKFGHTYLAKHGWAPGAGLGVTGDGRVSHIAVAQKLDQLGIGAGRPDGPDSIAWKQAKEFEGLLERLNAANGGAGGEDKADVVGESGEDTSRKDEDEGEGEEKKKEEKARRKEKRKEEKRKAKAEAAAAESSGSAPITPSTSTPESTPVATPAPRRLAHRARFLAAKRLAGTSSTALSEILGVSSTPTSTSESTPTPSTPASLPPNVSLSVADYFKSKMRERAQVAGGTTVVSTAVVTFEEPDADAAPRIGLGARRQDQEELVEKTRGLGFTNTTAGLGFTTASTGLGFTRATSPSPTTTPAPESHISTPMSDNTEPTKSDKEARKEKKRKRKEQATTSEVPAAEVNGAQEEERKAAKRARKEAKRAARQQQQENETVVFDDTVDCSSKKKRKVKEDEIVD